MSSYVNKLSLSPAAGFAVAVRPSPLAEDVGDGEDKARAALLLESLSCVFLGRLRQHPIEFLLRSFRPGLPTRDTHLAIALVDFQGHQRIAASFRDQRPMRSPKVVQLNDRMPMVLKSLFVILGILGTD